MEITFEGKLSFKLKPREYQEALHLGNVWLKCKEVISISCIYAKMQALTSWEKVSDCRFKCIICTLMSKVKRCSVGCG